MNTQQSQIQRFLTEKLEQVQSELVEIQMSNPRWKTPSAKLVQKSPTSQSIVVEMSRSTGIPKDDADRMRDDMSDTLILTLNNPEDFFNAKPVKTSRSGAMTKVTFEFDADIAEIQQMFDVPTSSAEDIGSDIASIPVGAEASTQTPPQMRVYSGLTDIALPRSDLKRVLGRALQGSDVSVSEEEFRRYVREYPNLKRIVERSAEERLATSKNTDEIREVLRDLTELNRATVVEDVGIAYKPKTSVPESRRVFANPRRTKPRGL